jgi:hypothetical protein
MSPTEFSQKDRDYALDKFGMTCFITGHPIEPGELEFDHIEPKSKGGPSDRDNIAPVCRKHNNDKRAMSLLEYRDKLEMNSFFDDPKPRFLNDVLAHKLGEFGERVHITEDPGSNQVIIKWMNGESSTYPLYIDDVKGYKYFYAKLPVSAIQNDTSLQPRPLELKRLWQLYQHLHGHTLLSPSIGRYKDNHIFIFDGQHKAAAQVWNGRKELDCKIYLDPDEYDIMQTNLDAHYSLKQMAFFSSIMIDKLAQLYELEWKTFMAQPGSKSEATFVSFLMENNSLNRPNSIKRLESAHKQAILDSTDPTNGLVQYISERNRNRKTPLTISTLEKTLFNYFITKPPLSDEFEGLSDYRPLEIQNVIRFMSMIAEETLDGQWNPELNNAAHQKAERFFYAGSIRAWSEVLRDSIVAGVLNLLSDEERSKIFYRDINESQFNKIRNIIQKVYGHTVWIQPWGPVLEGLKIANNVAPKEVFKQVGLTASWVLGIG